MLIDTHAHVNFNAFKDDADEVIRRSIKEGVFMINVGSQYSTSVRALKYAKKYKSGVWTAVGIHPIQLKKQTFVYRDGNELPVEEIKTNGEEFNHDKYFELAKNSKVVAIGEVGLDYHHFDPGDDIENLKKKQKGVFIQFIDLANEVKKPVIIHCWDAYDDLYEILKNNPVKKRGVVHSFVGGYKAARKFIDLGYKIGLNGIITFGVSYDRLIKEIDLKDILIETDCPYLTPMPKKGERNEPVYVKYIAEKIAEIKNIAYNDVVKITTQNASSIFNLKISCLDF
jgi:TatD DNase family protein